MFTIRSIKKGALAAALMMALPMAHAAAVSPVTSAKVNLRMMQPQAQYDRFIVTYANGSTERSNHAAAVQNIGVAIARAGMNHASRSLAGTSNPSLSAHYLRKLGIGAELIRTSHKLNASEATTLMRQIAADPAVVHVEPDVMMHAVRDMSASQMVQPADVFSGAPNDPNYATYQWHFNNAVGGADVANAWSLADGAGVTVAVLDTGITQHPDINMSLADAGYDFITDPFVSGRATAGRVAGGYDLGDWTTGDTYLATNGGCVDSTHPASGSSWHGTHVTGTATELTNNGVGMAGIAHAANVLPVRVLGHCGGYTSDIADGIVWASGGHVDGVPDNTHPAQVINMSLGGHGVCTASDVTGMAIAGANSRGTTVVVAAGNDGTDAANYSPASCPGVISVASNGITGKRAFYSNYGTSVSISAPGGGVYPNDGSSGTPTNNGFVWSALNLGTTTPGDPGYGGYAGTSQATPHVTGAVALIISAEEAAGLPVSTPAEIANILSSTARPFPVSQDHPVGVGIVDAAAAVTKAISTDGGNQPPAIVLAANTPLADQAGAVGTTTLYSVTVPAGARNLSLRSYGGTGDVTMFVKAGTAPNADGSNADITSVRPGNTETAVIRSPAATTYYILIKGVATYTKLTLLASYSL